MHIFFIRDQQWYTWLCTFIPNSESNHTYLSGAVVDHNEMLHLSNKTLFIVSPNVCKIVK